MPAPIYHARSLTELIALRAKTQPNDPAVHTGAPGFGEKLLTLTYADLQSAIDRLCAHYASPDLDMLPQTSSSTDLPPEQVIAVLTSTAIDETLLEVALSKLGLAPLLLSVNNSTAAVAHLCKITRSSHLIYGERYKDVARDAASLLAAEGYTLHLVKEHRYPLWGPGGVRDPASSSPITPYPARLTPEQEAQRTCVVLHSSGSTGFPKPVFISHFGMIANLAPAFPATGFSALPLFHGFGHNSIFRCIYHGKTFTLMPPHLPLTSANICRIIRASPTPPTQHFAVPYVLKMLGETEEGMATLAGFDVVSFAGAALPDELGDRLVAAGVPLVSFYGATETGMLLNSKRTFASDTAWNWVRAEGLIEQYLSLEPQGADTFEVVVKPGWPALIMSNRPDGSYATKDLVQRHPVHKSWYKVIGRLDDTLTQTLGEKTNPIPIELAIRGGSPLIQECIVFGASRPHTGALILPSPAGAALSADPGAYLKAVWPAIELANAAAPTHSRIQPEMVAVLPYGTDVPVATKMTILRPACYKMFAPIIDELYEAFENGRGGGKKRAIAEQEEMEAFLTAAIKEAIGGGGRARGALDPTTDLFAYGVDSLQATKVRNLISRSLDLGTEAELGQNIVYEHPSIRQLAGYLLGLRDGQASEQDQTEAVYRKMEEMVRRFSADILPRSATTASAAQDGRVVLLTGATGSLGAHLLYTFLRSPSVSRVVLLSRAPSHSASLDRVKASLATRLLQPSDEQLQKITSLAADPAQPRLGLTETEYEALRCEVTDVVHNAWPVNFILGLESYEEHIRGAVALLNLAQTSTAPGRSTFYFSSSVATRQGRQDPSARIISETFPDSPATAAGTGYGRSKWVVEKLVEASASKAKGAHAAVLRIGQLAGDTVHGVWNETEAWPLMFRGASARGSGLHALPQLEEQVGWLAVDLAARAIGEIVLAPAPSLRAPLPVSGQLQQASGQGDARVYHILNPRVAPFSTVLAGLAAGGLDFTPVERREWVRRLAASEPDPTANPTYKLLGFYTARIGQTEERPAFDFAVEATARVSPTIAGCEAVSEELVELWTRRWIQTGFL